jgi:hypothetical protein
LPRSLVLFHLQLDDNLTADQLIGVSDLGQPDGTHDVAKLLSTDFLGFGFGFLMLRLPNTTRPWCVGPVMS